MKISLSWLRRYVDVDVPVEELCEKMIMSGFEVESVEDLSASMSNVVAGRILKLEKHPDADRLQICQIDVGGQEPVQIVTGADNVFEGALVPAALHDSRLPNGMHIKKGKLRGVASNGMLCSGEELCLKESDYPGAEVHGILILQGDWAPGTDMCQVLQLDDVIVDFKITANRPDCQSVLGVAREAAVALKKPFHPPAPGLYRQGRGYPGPHPHHGGGSGALPPVLRPGGEKRPDGRIPRLDEALPEGGGYAAHQQHCGHHQFRHAGDRSTDARL